MSKKKTATVGTYGKKLYALMAVYGGGGRVLTVALDVEVAFAVEKLLREANPGHEVAYNAWTRMHALLLSDGVYVHVPIAVDGRSTDHLFVLPFEEGKASVNPLHALGRLPLEPIRELGTGDTLETLGSVMRGRTAQSEVEIRRLTYEDMRKLPEAIWMQRPGGRWSAALGNTMLGVWLSVKDGKWSIIPPTGTGAILPPSGEDRLVSYQGSLS